VKFQYSGSKRRGRRNTTCYIKLWEPDKSGEQLQILSKAKALLSKEDSFVKKVGRKVAFTKAVMNLFPSYDAMQRANAVDPIMDFEKNKRLRSKMWKKFLKECNI
jgi:hypothetical protein